MKESRKQIGSLVDAKVYRKTKARAAVEGIRVGALIDKALAEYLIRAERREGKRRNR